MLPSLSLTRLLIALAMFCMVVPLAHAHPTPDIPVRASFTKTGACQITVEFEPRCFEKDPDATPALLYTVFKDAPESLKTELKQQASAFIAATVEMRLEPIGRISPEFTFEFTGLGGVPLQGPEDVVAITGTWNTTIPAGTVGYRIHALPQGKLSVLFLNQVDGKAVDRIQVLFPGEQSYLLDLTQLSASMPTGPAEGSVPAIGGKGGWWATFRGYCKLGFLHVVPEGLDHILFVLGIFLLSREWKPLLWQVSTFTVAHTVTLGLATVGWVKVSPSIVEPIIAGSIAAVALENIFHPKYTQWRLLLVFAFGLIHGLGFAGALGSYDDTGSAWAARLIGFNVGVEGGQLAVISGAVMLTCWITDAKAYRQWIVIPGSVLIACAGLFWMIQRIVGWDFATK